MKRSSGLGMAIIHTGVIMNMLKAAEPTMVEGPSLPTTLVAVGRVRIGLTVKCQRVPAPCLVHAHSGSCAILHSWMCPESRHSTALSLRGMLVTVNLIYTYTHEPRRVGLEEINFRSISNTYPS